MEAVLTVHGYARRKEGKLIEMSSSTNIKKA